MSKETKQLEKALRDAVSNSSVKLSEREALETALDVADEWRMRLSEIEENDSE